MLAPKCEKYEEDTFRQYWVIAHFGCMCPCDLTYFPPNWVTWPEAHSQYMCLILSIADFVAPLLDNWRCHGNRLVTHLLGSCLLLMSYPEYEVDRTTQYWVMAHFNRIHYVSLEPWPLTYFHQNWVTWLGARAEYMNLFWSSSTFTLLKYAAINCRFCGPFARQPALPWQLFCAP